MSATGDKAKQIRLSDDNYRQLRAIKRSCNASIVFLANHAITLAMPELAKKFMTPKTQ